MMWMEGVGWLGGRPTCEGTKARNQCQEPLVSRQLAAARGEKSERRNAEGRVLEPRTGDRVDRATIQHGIASWTEERILS